MNKTAPIALFVYNRPEHTLRTLEALHANTLAEQSTLYIYCDGPKENASSEVLQNIREVRQIIKNKQWCGQVHIIESTANKGLSKSIREGIAAILEKKETIIILEDDIVTSKYFLEYMNHGLEKYKDEDKVKQISGHLERINLKKENGAFFMPYVDCWGWGTWKRVWQNIDFDASDYITVKNDKKIRYQFDLQGAYDYSGMLIRQKEKPGYNSWAVLFWWSIFKQKGVALFPDYSLINNIGIDNSGEHQGYDPMRWVKEIPWDNKYKINNFPEVSVSDKNFYRIRMYYKYDFIRKYDSSLQNNLLFMRQYLRKKARNLALFIRSMLQSS